MRVARPGEGKSGGYRVIVFFRSEEQTFFVYGFAKSNRDNIDRGELLAEDGKTTNIFTTEPEKKSNFDRGR